MKAKPTEKRIDWIELDEQFSKEKLIERQRLIRLLDKTKSQIETLISELSKE